MSWKDLFRSSKPGSQKPDPSLRWFGKLPTYADYYSSRGDDDWPVEFNDWVMKGYELYLSRLNSSGGGGRRLPLAACALRLPKSGMTVLGSIQDYGGDMRGRPFPMCFYVAVPTPQWPGPTSDRLSGAIRCVRDLMLLRRDVQRAFNSPGPFESRFGGRDVDVGGVNSDSSDTTWTRDAGKLSLADWFAAAASALKVDDLAVWLGLVDRWGKTIAEMDSADFEPTLRFPLAPGIATEVQVAGWVRWVESRLDLSRRTISLLVTSDMEREGGRLTLVARPPIPEDFLLLTPLAGTLSYIDDLTALANGGDPSGGGDGASGAVQPGTWLEFVQGAPAK